ncbi:MAG: helix-turn-helix transcriptional regulator [Culicoidibacterales bacterium]
MSEGLGKILVQNEVGKLLSRLEVAKLLGCSVGTVSNLCKLGELTPITFGTKGKCVRFLRSNVERFIAIKLIATARRVPKEGVNNA